jgi:RNA polymerase sigma-70 factor (ECF subfamily)
VAAFDQLYREFYPALSLLAWKLSRSRELAEDVVSDVFLSLWEGRKDLDKVVDLGAYLYVSTRNRTYNYLKSKAVSASAELTEGAMASQEPSVDDFFQTLLQIETVRALRAAVEVLPPECRKVLELVLAGHSTNEIASVLAISPSAVSHQKARAVRILKDNVLLLFLAGMPASVLVG